MNHIETLLALHEGFRRLGYPAEELFVEVYQDAVQFRLSHKDKTFTIGPIPADTSDFATLWPKSVDWWNAQEDKAAIQRIYESLPINAAELVMKMTEKGIYPP